MSEKYEEPEDGTWFAVHKRGHRIACCDCGLVHDYDFRVVDGQIQARARRHKRATVAMRRGMKRTVVVVPA